MSEEESTTTEASATEASAPPPAKDAPATASAPNRTRGLRKERTGIVVSDKMDKTIVVAVIRRVPHPKFRKIIKRTTKLYAVDEKGEASEGDKVRVREIKPVSKTKRWQLVEVLAHH